MSELTTNPPKPSVIDRAVVDSYKQWLDGPAGDRVNSLMNDEERSMMTPEAAFNSAIDQVEEEERNDRIDGDLPEV